MPYAVYAYAPHDLRVSAHFARDRVAAILHRVVKHAEVKNDCQTLRIYSSSNSFALKSRSVFFNGFAEAVFEYFRPGSEPGGFAELFFKWREFVFDRPDTARVTELEIFFFIIHSFLCTLDFSSYRFDI